MNRAYMHGTKAANVTAADLEAVGASGDGEWMARTAILAHARVDRDFERFSEGLLRDFARTLPGKPLLVGHNRGGLPEGIWTKAEVLGVGDAAELVATFAVPVIPGDATNEALRARINAGVAKCVSIGFEAERRVCDVCGDTEWRCNHWPGTVMQDGTRATATWMAPGEAVEGSVVWLGAQPGAELLKSAATADCVAGMQILGADPSGGTMLSWPAVARAAVRIAQRSGPASNLGDDERKGAWSELMAAYAAFGQAPPAWEPGQKFAWSDWVSGEEHIWFHGEALAELDRLAVALGGRIKGACDRLRAFGGSLPQDVTAAASRVEARLKELAPPTEAAHVNPEPAPATEQPVEEDAPQEEPATHTTLLAAIAAYGEATRPPTPSLAGLLGRRDE